MSDGIAGITIQAKLFATQGEQAQRLAWLATNARHERFHPGTKNCRFVYLVRSYMAFVHGIALVGHEVVPSHDVALVSPCKGSQHA